jgi:hypothetical protein
MDPLIYARFWSKVEVTQNTCRYWEWRARRNSFGYGQFKLHGTTTLAHRVALLLTGTHLDDNAVVMHHCDNPGCCNPTHLIVGSHEANVADRVSKGRSAKGGANGRAKLSAEQVIAIRADDRPQALIASEYGVTPKAVALIRSRRTWAHV